MSVGWGFVGTGGIARTVAAALELVPGGRLAAVASRDLARAEAFARDVAGDAGVRPTAHDDVADLLADPAVDAVYVATTHPQHHAPARAALEHGTPVLVEKPLTVSLAATRDLVELSRARRVFGMEAYWTRFLPGTLALLDVVRSGEVGEVRAVHADLGFPAAGHLARFHDPALGGGSLFDLGPYPVGLAVTLLGAPSRVRAVGALTPTGVDAQTALALSWGSGAVAALSTSMVAHATGAAWIEGSEGRIALDAPLHGVPRFTVSRPDATAPGGWTHRVEEHAVAHGHRFVLEHVHDCLARGLTESPVLGWQHSLDVAAVFEEAVAQVGTARRAEVLPGGAAGGGAA